MCAVSMVLHAATGKWNAMDRKALKMRKCGQKTHFLKEHPDNISRISEFRRGNSTVLNFRSP